jgi:hypothetical protein
MAKRARHSRHERVSAGGEDVVDRDDVDTGYSLPRSKICSVSSMVLATAV